LWGEIVPLEYLQIIEGARPDLQLRNLFFFREQDALLAHIERETETDQRSLVFLSNRAPAGISSRRYAIAPFRVALAQGAAPEIVGYVFTPVSTSP
jgi:hypothetical protein